jgi:hypothetical protein
LIPSFGKMFCSPPYPKCVENKVKPHYFFKRKLNTLVSTYEFTPISLVRYLRSVCEAENRAFSLITLCSFWDLLLPVIHLL